MTILTDEQIRALVDGATPGPWEADRFDGLVEIWARSQLHSGFYVCIAEVHFEANGDLITAAPDLAATALAAIAERDRLLVENGNIRICVNCGRTKHANESRGAPHPDCPSPDACTFDMTPREAVVYWRLVAHRYRVERNRLRAALMWYCEDTSSQGDIAREALKGDAA